MNQKEKEGKRQQSKKTLAYLQRPTPKTAVSRIRENGTYSPRQKEQDEGNIEKMELERYFSPIQNSCQPKQHAKKRKRKQKELLWKIKNIWDSRQEKEGKEKYSQIYRYPARPLQREEMPKHSRYPSHHLRKLSARKRFGVFLSPFLL
jgi:hypothetical protein